MFNRELECEISNNLQGYWRI